MLNVLVQFNRIMERRTLEKFAHRRYMGIPRPYHEAKDLGVVDLRIRDLVEAMNIPGVLETVASCEGHSKWWSGQTGPYVAYRATNDFVCKIEKLLREDEVSEHRKLFYCWSNRGYISSDFELIFSLQAPGIDTDKRTLKRHQLDADFKVLELMIKDASDERKTTSTIGKIENKSKCTNDKNAFKFSFSCFFTKRIECIALWAAPIFISIITNFSVANITRFQRHQISQFVNRKKKILTQACGDMGEQHVG